MVKLIKAIAVINSKKCVGTVEFEELPNKKDIKIKINLTNIKTGLHGFHIHETGNLIEGCSSCCSHFNPLNTAHGGKDSKERHIGDLGNIVSNSKNVCNQIIYDNKIKLRGNKFNIIGRSIVIHEKEDDLGKGGNKESLKTGNAGSRIGCGVIGYKEPYYF
jgi:superoxide dismutase, Cu-Zn family